MIRQLSIRRTWFRTLTLAAIVFAIVAVLSAVPVIRGIQLQLTDTFFRISPRPVRPPAAVLVVIDDESLRQYGSWPWSRTVLAQLTRNLAAARASVIGIDILLSEPETPAADDDFRQAISSVRHVVLVDKIGMTPTGSRWIEPLPQFAEIASVGHSLAALDTDGFCRRFPPHELSTDGSHWSFAIEVARVVDAARTEKFLRAYDVPFKDDIGAVVTAAPTLIPISFRRDGFRTISAADVIAGRKLDGIGGRPVLVGFGASEISDRLVTPLSGALPTPGVEVHAQILDAIVDGRILKESPLWVSALLVAVISAVAVFTLLTTRGWAALWLLLALAIGIYAISLLGFVIVSRVLPVGAMLFCVVLSPAVAYTADFILVERSLARQLVELRRWLVHRRGQEPSPENADLSWRLDLLHELQTQLGTLYELHHALLRATQDLIAIFDQHGELLFTNERFTAACDSLGHTSLTLENFRALLAPRDEAPLVQHGSLIEGEAYLGDELYSVCVAPMPPTSLSPGGGSVVTLSSLRARLERDRARAEAVGFITHELRTPLVAIQGFSELMMKYPESPACERAPQTIFHEAKRLLALTNSYHDVLRLDAGARPLKLAPVRLDNIVRQTFEILELLAAGSGMHLRFEDSGPVWFTGDAPLLGGAVLNLLSNAIKYGRPGTDVIVRCEANGNDLVLSVENTGDPLPPAELHQIFDPYYRGPKGSGKPGWGLGLAFVRRIAEKHGGVVRGESLPHGVRFEIHLPAAARAEVTIAQGA
jgi:signal transduction histidine kinase